MIKSFLQRYFYIILILLSSAIFSIFSFDIDGNIRNIKLAFLISFLSSFFILREFQDNEKIVFLLTFLIFSLVVYFFSKIQSRIDFEFFPQNSLLFAIPFFVLPSVLLYIIGEKKTIYTSSFVSLVSYFIHKDFSLSFIWFICSFVVLISLKKARRRISLFKVGVFYGLCGTFLIFILENGFSKSFLFLFSSLFSPFISVGLIYFIERTFRILTPFYLFDLQDFENPLLVQLRKRAPGTFHHSLFVADIASSVAEKLGVNAELVRCAALYHDVGKIIRPAYFIENLKGLEKHLKINPPLSSKVIIKHVEDGVKLARSYNIPERIIDFIREHHGTTYPEFFIKAAEEENPNFEVRYPGPSPRSVETVIVMIADSCEAALRSLEEITSDKIAEIVERVIEKKMEMRQFDNAPITLEQLNKIKSATIETLIEFYHPRISYSEEKIKYYLHLKKEKYKQEENKEENGTNSSHTNNKYSDGIDKERENGGEVQKRKIKNSE